MKANQKDRDENIRNNSAFTFLIPMTMIIIVTFALLAVGAYVVGIIGSTLEDTMPNNTATGSIDDTYTHGGTTDEYENVSLPTTADDLDDTLTNFYIQINGSHHTYYNLSINSNPVNISSILVPGIGYNVTLATLISNGNVSTSDEYLNYSWDVNNSGNTITIRIYDDSYFTAADFRTTNENSTVALIGDITVGFSDVVDIEIVVIIITALSMAILAIMAVGSRKSLY